MAKVLENTAECWRRLQAEYRAALNTQDSFNARLESRYGSVVYANTTESKHRETLREKTHKAANRCFAWLEQYSPRVWRSGVPYHWICTELTFDDATTTGPLATIPPFAYGRNWHDPQWLAHA